MSPRPYETPSAKSVISLKQTAWPQRHPLAGPPGLVEPRRRVRPLAQEHHGAGPGLLLRLDEPAGRHGHRARGHLRVVERPGRDRPYGGGIALGSRLGQPELVLRAGRQAKDAAGEHRRLPVQVAQQRQRRTPGLGALAAERHGHRAAQLLRAGDGPVDAHAAPGGLAADLAGPGRRLVGAPRLRGREREDHREQRLDPTDGRSGRGGPAPGVARTNRFHVAPPARIGWRGLQHIAHGPHCQAKGGCPSARRPWRAAAPTAGSSPACRGAGAGTARGWRRRPSRRTRASCRARPGSRGS